jgi:hypothetical protein
LQTSSQNVGYGSLVFSASFNASGPKRCSRHEACSRERIPGTGAAYSHGFKGLVQKHEALTNASRSELLPQDHGIGSFHPLTTYSPQLHGAASRIALSDAALPYQFDPKWQRRISNALARTTEALDPNFVRCTWHIVGINRPILRYSEQTREVRRIRRWTTKRGKHRTFQASRNGISPTISSRVRNHGRP